VLAVLLGRAHVCNIVLQSLAETRETYHNKFDALLSRSLQIDGFSDPVSLAVFGILFSSIAFFMCILCAMCTHFLWTRACCRRLRGVSKQKSSRRRSILNGGGSSVLPNERLQSSALAPLRQRKYSPGVRSRSQDSSDGGSTSSTSAAERSGATTKDKSKAMLTGAQKCR
jgi:hypothetical protein